MVGCRNISVDYLKGFIQVGEILLSLLDYFFINRLVFLDFSGNNSQLSTTVRALVNRRLFRLRNIIDRSFCGKVGIFVFREGIFQFFEFFFKFWKLFFCIFYFFFVESVDCFRCNGHFQPLTLFVDIVLKILFSCVRKIEIPCSRNPLIGFFRPVPLSGCILP